MFKVSLLEKKVAAGITWHGDRSKNEIYSQNIELIEYLELVISKYFKVLKSSMGDDSAYYEALYEKSNGKFYLKLLYNSLTSKFKSEYDFKYKALSSTEVKRMEKKWDRHYEVITVISKNKDHFDFLIKYDYRDGNKYRDDIYEVSFKLQKI